MSKLRFVLLALLIAVPACEDSPGPGQFTVNLVSPNSAEGAALIRLVGPGLLGVSPIEGEVHGRIAGDTLEVVVLRETPGRLRFEVEVSDSGRRPRAQVVQVAGPNNELRGALSDYVAEVYR